MEWFGGGAAADQSGQLLPSGARRVLCRRQTRQKLWPHSIVSGSARKFKQIGQLFSGLVSFSVSIPASAAAKSRAAGELLC